MTKTQTPYFYFKNDSEIISRIKSENEGASNEVIKKAIKTLWKSMEIDTREKWILMSNKGPKALDDDEHKEALYATINRDDYTDFYSKDDEDEVEGEVNSYIEVKPNIDKWIEDIERLSRIEIEIVINISKKYIEVLDDFKDLLPNDIEDFKRDINNTDLCRAKKNRITKLLNISQVIPNLLDDF